MSSATPDGTRSTFARDFELPLGLAFDAADNLYVADNAADTIYKITPDKIRTVFASMPDPLGLVFDGEGNLFATDYGDGVIMKITPDGTQSVYASGLTSPGHLAIQPQPLR